MNKIILVGNVGNTPEIKEFRDSNKSASFSLATTESFKDKQGNKQQKTEWHNVTAWAGLAKVVESIVIKGTKLLVEGRIRYKKYEKNGETKYFTEIQASHIEILTPKSNTERTDEYTDDLPY